MTQKEEILDYIRDFGSISTMEAFRDLHITKLTTRISELIQDGVDIRKTVESGKNRYGKKIWWMRYSLG